MTRKRAQERAKPGAIKQLVDERIDEILVLWASGYSFERICRELKLEADGRPALAISVRGAVLSDPDHNARFLLASQARAHALFERTTELAFEAEQMARDTMKPAGFKIAIDAHAAVAAQLMPDKFNPKQKLEMSGPDGGPIQVEADVTLTPAEAYERMVKGK